MSCEMNESRLAEAIRAARFALIELQLFLDTHPSDAEALRSFAAYNRQLAELTAHYTQHYGPLTLSDVSGDNGWTWSMTPMPWEGGN